jgi:hypothetical protein
MALESQRLLRRTRSRRASRVTETLAGTVTFTDDTGETERRPARIVDLTVFGASVMLPAPALSASVVESADVTLEIEVPRPARLAQMVTIGSSVRHGEPTADAARRVGLEFTSLDRTAADALVRHCIVGPARALLEESGPFAPASRRATAFAPRPHRRAARAAAFVAIAGAAATAESLSLPASIGGVLVRAAVGVIALAVVVGAVPGRSAGPSDVVQSLSSHGSSDGWSDFAIR